MCNRTLLVTLSLLAACKGNTDSSSDDSQAVAEPYGPENDWYHADVDEVSTHEDTGWEQGDTIPNLKLYDQNGDEVWLYQFTGRTLFIDWAAEWCGPCHDAAPEFGAVGDKIGDRGVALTVISQNQASGPGDADAVSNWSASYGSEHPITYLQDESWAQAPDIESWPSYLVIDPKNRLAIPNMMRLEDYWRDQMFDRMAFMAGGNLDHAEICDDGIDNDLNGAADCMESACSAECGEVSQTGSLTPCKPDQEADTSTRDTYTVVVSGGVARVQVDTISADTTFDIITNAIPEGGDWAEPRHVGDDEVACTYPAEHTGCVDGWLTPGTWTVAIIVGTGGTDPHTGDCPNPDLGEYVLRISGDATIEPLEDNIQGSY